MVRAEQRLRVGQVNEAQADIDASLKLIRDNSDADALASVISVVKNEKQRALALAQHATQLDPVNPRAWVALSYAQQASFKLEDALHSTERAAELTPRSSLAQGRIAELLMSLGKIRSAERAAQAAVAANPNDSRAHTILGFVHLAEIDIKKAHADFEAAIELDSSDPLPRLGLGLAIIRKGDLKTGREQIEIAVALDPTNSLLRSYVGKAYYEENTAARDKLAATQFGLAKQLDPKDPTPWFYDAILKQTQNRPVDALENLQKSIQLNDNRAVYRSRLLLDQDDAARMSTLAGVYQELGFEQLALLQGGLALAADPESPGAHRLLADIYSTLPGYETARESELLQSQLEQPLSLLPTAPLRSQLSPLSIAARSHLLTAAGPTKVSLGEFNPLFLGDGAAFYADALVGSFDTLGGQAVATGLYGPLGVSAGYGHFQTQQVGTSTNVDSNAYDALFQVQLAPGASIQAEAFSFRDKRGDSIWAFDPTNITPFTVDDSLSRLRFGARYAPDPGSQFLFSAFHQERTANFFYTSLGVTNIFNTDANSLELRYSAGLGPVALTLGAGHADASEGVVDAGPQIPSSHDNAYGYAQLSLADSAVRLQFGLSVDHLDDTAEKFERKEVNPKLGLILVASPGTVIRAAAFQTVQRKLIASQTLEPTQVAGFNQLFEDPTGTIARELAIALDQSVTRRFDVGVEARERQLTVPLVGTANGFDDFNWYEREVDGYAYLLAPPRELGKQAFSCSGSLRTELAYRELRRQDLPDAAGIVSLDTQLVSFGLGVFCASSVTFQLVPTYIQQSGLRQAYAGANTFPIDESFWMTNIALAYFLPRRLGRIVIGVNNLFDKHVDVQTTDPLLPVFPAGRFVYLGVSLEL